MDSKRDMVVGYYVDFLCLLDSYKYLSDFFYLLVYIFINKLLFLGFYEFFDKFN